MCLLFYLSVISLLNVIWGLQVSIFRPGSMRVMDNPAFSDPSSMQAVFIHDPIYESFEFKQDLDAAVTDLKVRLPGLVELHGESGPAVVKYMERNALKSRDLCHVSFCMSSLQPFRQADEALEATLLQAKIPHTAHEDTMVPVIGSPSDRDGVSSMVFRAFKKLYDVKNVPVPDVSEDVLQQRASSLSPKGGESLAVALIIEYLKLGDDNFTQKYGSKYMDLVKFRHVRTPEHALAINRVLESKSSFRGEVFTAIMAPLLALGCISPRVMTHARQVLLDDDEQIIVDRPLNCVIRAEAVRRDWAIQLATATGSGKKSEAEGGWDISYTYWRAFAQREGIFRGGDATTDPSKPIAVLVHGFGGSLDQFTNLARPLSKDFHVVAFDSLGFGCSEKPPLSYNQYLWRDQCVDVVRRARELTGSMGDIVLVGNSIGGFTATSAAAYLATTTTAGSSTPECGGLVLLNSAGRIASNDVTMDDLRVENLFTPYKGPPAPLLGIFGQLVFSLLQPRIKKTCEWLYPTYPSVVGQSGLAQNIFRDSCDPGAPLVIASGGKLPRPRAVNVLLEEYTGPVLVTQGALDPLNDAPDRAAKFKAIRTGIDVDLLDLGHCPHDENGTAVAQSISEWWRKQKRQ